MKISISSKIVILVFSLVLSSTLIVGFLVEAESKEILVEQAEARLKYETQLKAQSIQNQIKSLGEDVKYLLGTPPIRGIARAKANKGIDPKDGSSLKLWKDRLVTIFKELLRAKGEYVQVRFIGAENNSKEVVRVNRFGNSLVNVRASELQSKGDGEFYKETKTFPPGEVNLSQITLNRENGKIVEPHMPVIRSATPFYYDSEYHGMLVINLDARKMLRDFYLSTPKEFTPNLVNSSGDYLVHAVEGKVFGWDLGKKFSIQDDFPELDLNMNSDPRQKNVVIRQGDTVLHFVRAYFDSNHPKRFLGISLSTSKKDLLARANMVRQKSFILVVDEHVEARIS